MSRALRPEAGRLFRVASLALLTFGGACSGAAPPTEDVAEPLAGDVTVSGEPEDSAAPVPRRFLPDEMRRSTRAETFPHTAHAQISCAVCHDVPPGHGSHSDVECAACHRASATATVRALSPGQCAACHHDPQQAFGCEHCHESRGVVQSEQQLALEVWGSPRTRTLAFDHARHAALSCASCHREQPMLVPARPCASCHEEHHVATVRCQSCHAPPPPGAHDVQAHLTCSGSGCHRAPDVEAIAGTRAVCLVCHQAQEDHEPGGACIECHRVRPGLDGGRAP